jgi:hypothetical protein
VNLAGVIGASTYVQTDLMRLRTESLRADFLDFWPQSARQGLAPPRVKPRPIVQGADDSACFDYASL